MAGVAVASLVLAPVVALTPAASAVTTTDDIFISEIHYDNDGVDEGEAIEVQAPVGTDLSGWQIVLYNGNDGAVYDTKTLAGAVGDAGVVVQDYAANGIQNGSPDGMALVANDGAVVELLSYEGVFDAVGGPADGLTSTDIGVSQPGSTPIGQSLQRIDGEWVGPVASSFGERNTAAGDPDPDPDPEPTDPVPIAQIQGTGDQTPLADQVVTTRGVVTGVYPEGGFSGAFIQTPGTGGDLEGHDASHGIFVYGGNSDFADDVELGDYVEVTGTAGEHFGLTQITHAAHSVLDQDVDDVVPAQIGLPALDEREAYEGMLLAPQGDFTVTDTYHTNRFGWVGWRSATSPCTSPPTSCVPGPTSTTRSSPPTPTARSGWTTDPATTGPTSASTTTRPRSPTSTRRTPSAWARPSSSRGR